jgi:hypothetical protein
MGADIASLGELGGIASFVTVLGLVLWTAWQNISPKITSDKDRIEQAQGAVHSDLVSRIDAVRASEREALERIDILEEQLDRERELRRTAEDEAAQERLQRRLWEAKHRRAVDQLLNLGRDDLARAAESIEAGAVAVSPDTPA